MLIVSAGGMRSIKPFAPAPLAHCVFEHVYFSRPDSYVFGKSVNEVRTNLGRMLAREQPRRRRRRRAGARLGRLRGDRLSPRSPASRCAWGSSAITTSAARSSSRSSRSATSACKVKLNPVRSILEGKRVVLVDDSIVRGTTSRKIVRMVRAAGATRSARADQLPADDFAVLLRRRHAAPLRADRGDAHARRDSRRTSTPTAWRISASRGC